MASLGKAWRYVVGLFLFGRNFGSLAILAAIRRASSRYVCRRPLLQRTRPLPDGHADTRSVLGPAVKDPLGLFQAAAGEQQFGYALTVARPLLDLVEVAVVRNQRLVGFFVGPIIHSALPGKSTFCIVRPH
jgi:hypothetical protein